MSRRPFVRKGRRAPFSQLGDWVLCAGIDPPAIAIYWALEAMTWRAQGEDGESHVTHEAEPGRETLAELMGFSRPQSVDRYIDQLVAINAVEVEARPGYPNSYVVHQAPPDDYTGPQSMGQWHNRRAERKTAERDAKTASHPQAPDQQELGSSQVSGGCAPQRTSPKRRYAPQRTGGVRHSAHEGRSK